MKKHIREKVMNSLGYSKAKMPVKTLIHTVIFISTAFGIFCQCTRMFLYESILKEHCQ